VAQTSDFPQQKQAQGATSPLEKFLADARLHLVETGTRNRLVHTPRASKRTRSLALSDIDADDVFATLVRNPKTIRFLARDGDDEAPLLALPDQVARNVSSGLMLQTILASEPLEKRLLSIYRDAKIAEEEQGINILYLAIGFFNGSRTKGPT
jgi:hypothetical protein